MPRPVVLASASPRRQALLRELVAEFEVVVADLDEEALTVADPWETAQRLAEAKARAVLCQRPDALVIGGDTVVALENDSGYQQLAKPRDAEDARHMLRALSDRAHVVITGFCLASQEAVLVDSDTTRVRFRDLSDEEIAAYVATGEPMDKAGAYAIQGGAAGFVAATDGSISNVVGLPLEKLRPYLDR